MGFSTKIKEEVLELCARHCCVCHRYSGGNMEVHHIKPQAEGGEDILENAIPLCFDCHAFAGHYNPKHPKGIKYSQEGLLKNKENWFKKVKEENITSKPTFVELLINNKEYKGFFEPIFIKEKTSYIERDSFSRVYTLLGKDPMELVNEIKASAKNSSDAYYRNIVNKIETFDQYLDFINGDFPRKDFIKVSDIYENTDCQPINYVMPSILGFNYTEEKNLSNCIINLKFVNHGPQVLEDFKLYFTFDNIVEINSVTKRKSWDDMYKYSYNIKFSENQGEFIPNQNILVQNDSVKIDSICFRTNHKTKDVVIKWELFARDFQDNGLLKIKIKPVFEKSERTKYELNANQIKNKIRILPKIETY